MFSDSDTSYTGFASSCELARESEDISVQTENIRANDKEIQTRDLHTIAIQAQEEDFKKEVVKYDEEKLAAFLSRICPSVIKELDRVSRNNAFASYSLTSEEEEEVRVLTVLRPTSTEGKVKISELSWSCTGSVLAIASSHSLHTSWCSHQGRIQLHNVDRDSKTATRTLEAASCVRSVSMHPYLASIVAAGTTTGEVLVWDTSLDGSEAALVNTNRTVHSDGVTRVCWVLGTGTTVTLVSAALDGHLYLWKVSPQLASYQLLERYKCEVSSTEAGITSFAFPYHQQDKFVVALEGGALVHCSFVTARPIASVQVKEAVKDPTVSCFEYQPATVTCVEFSPHADDLFATVSTDNAVRIYSLYQNCAQRMIWGAGDLVGLAWTPGQTHVLACWGHSHSVSLFNTHTGETLTSLSPGESEPSNTYLSTAAFNAKSSGLLAVGDLDGVTQVWKVPTLFSTKAKQ